MRTTADSADLLELQEVGASVLVVPVPGAIVRTATQAVSGGGSELVRFKVPKANARNRFWTSLQLPATDNGRAAPEYANIRQVVTPKTGGGFKIEDLNQRKDTGTAAAEQFTRKLRAGGYEAAHFVDGTCDGVISLKVPAGLLALRVLPAYSLVSAVDYFPGVEQVEIEEWVEQVQHSPIGLGDPSFQFAGGAEATQRWAVRGVGDGRHLGHPTDPEHKPERPGRRARHEGLSTNGARESHRHGAGRTQEHRRDRRMLWLHHDSARAGCPMRPPMSSRRVGTYRRTPSPTRASTPPTDWGALSRKTPSSAPS